MPFDEESQFQLKLSECLESDWSTNESELREVSNMGKLLVSRGVLCADVEEMFFRFQSRYHAHYATSHNLSKFMRQLVQHAVQTHSTNPVVELISAIDKKVIQ